MLRVCVGRRAIVHHRILADHSFGRWKSEYIWPGDDFGLHIRLTCNRIGGTLVIGAGAIRAGLRVYFGLDMHRIVRAASRGGRTGLNLQRFVQVHTSHGKSSYGQDGQKA